MFSECMAQRGWTVPDGKNEAKAAGAAAVPAAAAVAAGGTATALTNADKAGMNRSADCAFARSNASVSHIDNLRAQACDAECAQRLKAAPGAPRPSACAADPAPPLASEAN